MPFLTLEDPNAKIKGSRDPLGLVPVWSSFGRHVVTNLTTQSTSVRGFTTLLLGRYLAARLIDEGTVDKENALDIFLRTEQVCAYARHVGHGVESGIRGIERVKRFLDESNGRPEIRTDQRGAILSDQKVYGLWGLYSAPARASGIIPEGPAGVTEPARALIEGKYLSVLRPHLKSLDRLVSSGGRLDTRQGKSELFAALVEIFSETYTSDELVFYGEYLRDGASVEAAHAVAGRQARFRKLIEDAIGDETPANERAELQHLAEEAQQEDQELARRLQRILHMEAFLAPAAALFDFVLSAGRNRRPEDLGDEARERWGKAPPNIDPNAFQDLRTELRNVTGEEIDAAAAQCHEHLARGDYSDAIRALLEWNRQVMNRRSAGPWVTVGDNGRLDVRLPLAEGKLPGKEELPTLWRNSYFIDSLKSVTAQLGSAA